MAQSKFMHVKISGVSAVVPQKEISLLDELQYFDGNEKKALRMTNMVGLEKRRVADKGVTASDLCCEAANNLLNGINIDRKSIDALIFISQSPDYRLPATAGILQHRLGLPKTCATFDVNQGCTAFTYGLWLSSSLIESGAVKRVLLLVGESAAGNTFSENRVVAPVFGDSGTATLLEYSKDDAPSWFMLGTDGGGYESLIAVAGQLRVPPTPENFDSVSKICRDSTGTPWCATRTYMDGGAIFSFSIETVPPHIKELLAFSGDTPDSIEMLLLHQSNKQIIQEIAIRSGFPLEKAPYATLGKYGNQAGASIPGVLVDLFPERLRQGPFRVAMSGYGVGLSWASCVMTLDDVWCEGIKEYVTPKDHPTPESLLEYWHAKYSA